MRPEYFLENDPEFVKLHNIRPDANLIYDIDMKGLVRVDDVFRDETTFHKTIQKGVGTASPYMDCLVACNFKLLKYFSEG